MNRKNLTNGWIYILIIALGFILYGNSLKNDYALDDAIVITQNKFTQQGIKGIGDIFKYDSFVGFWLNSYPDRTPEQIQEDKKLVAGGRYRPLSLATFAVEKDLFGNSPGAHHLINLLIYILTAIVLYHFLSALFERKTGAWWQSVPLIAVLFFMAHPLHTEVVANIKGRDELLSFLGALIAGIEYFKYLKENKTRHLIFAGVSIFFGLMSKENAITWLAVIPVAAWFFVESDLKKHIRPLIALVVPAVIFLIIRQSVLGWGGSGEDQIAGELMNNPFLEAEGSERAGTILFTFWMYIKLLFFPHPLTYDYYPYHVALTGMDDPVSLTMLVLYIAMILTAAFILIRNFKGKVTKTQKYIALMLLMYLAPISVVSNVFFPVGVFMAERFLYFSSLGFVLMLAMLLVFVCRKLSGEKVRKSVLLVLSLAVLGLYGFKTIDRNADWKDDFTLFTTDVKTSSNSAKANTTAGGKLLEKAKGLADPRSKDYNQSLTDEYVDQAITYLQKALDIHPGYADPMLLLGNAYYQKNRDIAMAVHWYTELLKIRPYHNLAVQNTRTVLPQVIGLFAENKSPNTPDEIIRACEEFDAVKPGVPEVYRTIGLMYARYKNDFETAIPYYEKALSINPDDRDALKDLGVIYGQSGEFEKALDAFVRVHEITPSDAQVVFNIAVSYQNMGRMEEAKKWFATYQSMTGGQ